MAKNERNQDLLPENRDDFTKIKGIGQSISQALHEANIFSFADLAKCTPEKLVELLQPRVGFVTLQRITRDNWLGQARDLAYE